MKRSDPAEKRQFGRRPATLLASIRVAGREPMPCLINNISAGGALVFLDQDVPLPQSFRLTSEDLDIDRIVEMRYKLARLVGVEFIAQAVSQEQAALIAQRANEFDAWLDLTMR